MIPVGEVDDKEKELREINATLAQLLQEHSQTKPIQDLLQTFATVLRIRIHRIHMILGLPDPLVRGMDPDPDPDPSIIMQE
jgi:hypothetical protein